MCAAKTFCYAMLDGGTCVSSCGFLVFGAKLTSRSCSTFFMMLSLLCVVRSVFRMTFFTALCFFAGFVRKFAHMMSRLW